MRAQSCPLRRPSGGSPQGKVDAHVRKSDPHSRHVERLRDSLPKDFEYDERELALLDLAQAQAADIDRLEADIAERGVRVGEKLNHAVAEARQSRVALARILGQIDLPEAGTTRSLHGRKAAEARWKRGAA